MTSNITSFNSKKLTARSWLSVGESTNTPKVGDVVVFWRESPKSWKGHVGFFIKETKNYVYVLGGNQRNMVCIKAYAKSRVLDYKKLRKINSILLFFTGNRMTNKI